jgi:hypothetical protein
MDGNCPSSGKNGVLIALYVNEPAVVYYLSVDYNSKSKETKVDDVLHA